MKTTTIIHQPTDSDIKEWKHQLSARLVGCDIPKERLKLKPGDISWLNRNFWIKNSKSPVAKEVMHFIRLLLKAGEI